MRHPGTTAPGEYFVTLWSTSPPPRDEDAGPDRASLELEPRRDGSQSPSGFMDWVSCAAPCALVQLVWGSLLCFASAQDDAVPVEPAGEPGEGLDGVVDVLP